jgi:hypothetical protein
MKKLLVWFLIILVSAFASFLAGYYYSAGKLTGFIRDASTPKGIPTGGETGGDGQGGYRIGLVEELAEENNREKNGDDEQEISREKKGDALVIRRPLGGINLVLITDGSNRMATPDGKKTLEVIHRGLDIFLSNATEELKVGLRTMGGGEGAGCDESLLLIGLDRERGDWDRSVLEDLAPGGPRNISRAMYLAAGDMATYRGKKGMVLITAGGEECGEWPCETAESLFLTPDQIRTYVLEMEVEEEESESGDDPGAGQEKPEAEGEAVEGEEDGGGENDQDVGCLARVGDGFRAQVEDAEEIAGALDRVVSELSRNAVFRFFRTPGHELLGEEDPSLAPWKISVTPLTGTMRQPTYSVVLPARFHLPPGRYRIVGTYRGVEATLPELSVIPGQELEVQLTFRVGQLMVTEGERPWEDDPSGCAPDVWVHPSGNQGRLAARGCGLPSHFILKPGRYDLVLEGRDQTATVTGIRIAEGRAVVKEISPEEPEVFGPPPAGVEEGGTFIIDKKQTEN